MAHYLWNASLLVSEFISGFGVRGTLAAEVGWSVNGKKVIELGAGRAAPWRTEIRMGLLIRFSGSGLVSIITALAGAREVVVTDYPDPDLLSTIRKNIGRNIPGYLSQKIVFEGHEWGVLEIQPAKDYRNVFDIVIAADCFWIPAEHSNLITSMQHFLSRSVDARIWAVAGFHTGRGVLAQFLDHAKEVSLTVEKVWERDMFGLERDFVHSEEERREDTTERSKWLMIAVLRRRVQGDGE